MEVLKVLSECLEEKPELSELDEVVPMFGLARRRLLGVVEGGVDRVLAVKKVVTLEYITHSLINLKVKQLCCNDNPGYAISIR